MQTFILNMRNFLQQLGAVVNKVKVFVGNYFSCFFSESEWAFGGDGSVYS